MKYLKIEEVIYHHDRLVDEYGGITGIRDLGLLSSALAMPMQSFNGKQLHRSLMEKACAYLFHIIKNHPFFDGNKRTAVFCFILFLTQNNYKQDLNTETLYETAIDIANNKINKTNLLLRFQKQCLNK